MRLFVRSLSALALALAACTGSTEPGSIAGRLTGTWSENIGTPGGSFTMVLAARDTTVSGTGHYDIEAGRSGTIAVTGVIEAPYILLTVTYDYGLVAYYSATLQGQTSLSGAWRTVSDPVVVSFTKVAP